METAFKNLKFKPFNAEQLEFMRRFHERIEYIRNSRIIRTDSLNGSIHMDFKRGSIESDFPDDDDLRSLLVLIRPCLLQEEPTFFVKILNILKMNSADDNTFLYFKRVLQSYYESLKDERGLKLNIGKKLYNDEQLFDLWIHGFLFHEKDEDKRKELENLKDMQYAIMRSVIITTQTYLTWFCLIDSVLMYKVLSSNSGTFSIKQTRN